jgi:CheY-like chemotaxis protein
LRTRRDIHRSERSASSATPTFVPAIRILVADDQSMVRAGFRMLLSGEEGIEVVAEASNGLEAVAKAARFEPTVVADPGARVLVALRRACA